MNIEKLIKDDLDSKYHTTTSSTDIKKHVDFVKVKKKENVLFWKLTSFSLASIVIIFITLSCFFYFNHSNKKTSESPKIPTMNILVNDKTTLNISFKEEENELMYYYQVEGEITPFTIMVGSISININKYNHEGVLYRTTNTKSNLTICIVTNDYEEQLLINTTLKQ